MSYEARIGLVRMASLIRSEGRKVDTTTKILEVAERLVQIRGFYAFSYAEWPPS